MNACDVTLEVKAAGSTCGVTKDLAGLSGVYALMDGAEMFYVGYSRDLCRRGTEHINV